MTYFYEKHKVINPFRSHTPRGFYHKVKGHTGLDFDTPTGTPLALPQDMTVAEYLVQPQMGKTLFLRDKHGNILVFSHLDDVFVSKEDRVPRNKVFAPTGNTGSATTGTHLHFEDLAQKPEPGLEYMTRKVGPFTGYNIDPMKYLDSLSHWADEALDWHVQHQLTKERKDPDSPVTWGELAVLNKRTIEKSLEWARS